ncbi:beta-ketoacyl synthase chain length factor [Fictibacillus sp. KIGAM418]|uniref:Beta-ketoacyl synthase chain length factor n=1 Tax=Fictibacillus marinisediminis TaxID=2878389 RepID=A0A9X2BJA0_9BACL|nr:beta-ketoacyl synthase N-terminal-like domain-containing protein [Fictibacillus marinisediminis]MCK6259438.1 beta-ketoacyl synthase chain length factor [Fictibacillus marinisediminis]
MVYISGFSSISPFGIGIEKLIGRMQKDSTASSKNRLPNQLVYSHIKGLNRLPKVSRYGCIAVSEALRFAGYKWSSEKDSRVGVVVSNNYGSLEAIQDMFEECDKYGPTKVNPSIFPGTVLNVVGGHISIVFKFNGPNITLSEGIDSGFKSLLYAYDLIQQGKAENVLVCDLNIFPPPKYKSEVEDFLPDFECVGALLLEKTPKNKKHSLHLSINPANKEGGPLEMSRNVIREMIIKSFTLLKDDRNSNDTIYTHAIGHGEYCINISRVSE